MLTDRTSSPDELEAWLGLLTVPRLGPVQARCLLSALGSPQKALASPASVWGDVLGKRWSAQMARPDALVWSEAVARTRAWLQADAAAVLTLADEAYPEALLHMPDPPLLLFVQGRLDRLKQPAVAMVGSRQATPGGGAHAHDFAQALSAAGVCVVSGLAEGIDAAAHRGALSAVPMWGADAGSTVAVLGTGVDVVYPAMHAALSHEIASDGLLVSEFLLGTPPHARHFPRRNRIVAGLSQATLVVEAAVPSGSLITARLAADMGRDVMAIPGSVHSPQSRGCHALIKQGAKLVETVQDVLDELSLPPTSTLSTPAQGMTPVRHAQAVKSASDADPLLDAMGFDAVTQDTLSARTGMGPAELGARLLELELSGRVARLPGMRFQRMAYA